MSLDTRSLVYVNMAVFLVLGFAMAFLWRTRKTYPGFGLWAVGNFVIAMGQLLLGLRDVIPNIFSVLLANLLISAYYALLIEGLRRFLSRGSKWVNPLFLLGLVLSFLYFNYVDDNISERIILVSLCYASMSAFASYQLFKSAPWNLRSVYWFNGGIFFINCGLMIARAFYVATQPEITNLFEANPVLAFFSMAAISISVLWTFGIIFLNIDRLEQELKDAQQELERLAICDSLTGSYNHRYFFEVGKNEVKQARRYNHPLAVIAIDIDYFKQINDTYGHSKGNEVLIGFVAACHSCLRDADIFGRLGGDEFGAILPDTDLEEAQIVAERLSKTIRATAFPARSDDIHITASIGFSNILEKEEGIEAAFQRADMALYTVKHHGRNSVAVFPPDFTVPNDTILPT